MTSTAMLALPAADAVTHSDSSTRLIIAAVLGVAVIVVLIVWSRMHPFLALTLGSAVLAVAAGIPLTDTFKAFTRGLGSTIGDVGVLIAFGAIIGRLLIDSGGADQIVDTILARTSGPRLPWAMALIAFVVGIPLFFEVGIVLLIPVVMIVARRARQPLVLVGVPALAGLSALHGLVPPHPGPLIAIDAVGANLGMTLGLGLLVAVPTVIISGPLAARVMAGWVPVEAPEPLGGSDRAHEGPRPSFGASLSVILLPVVLMLLRTVVETLVPEDTTNPLAHAALFIGQPVVALLITVLVAMRLFGTRLGLRADEVSGRVGASLGPIAGILLIVGAGGRLQADPRRLRHRRHHRHLDPAGRRPGAAGGLARRRRGAPGHGIGDRRHRHGRGDHGAARRRHALHRNRPPRAGDRCWLGVPLPCQRRRLLAGQGVLRVDGGADLQDLVAHGDHPVGDRHGGHRRHRTRSRGALAALPRGGRARPAGPGRPPTRPPRRTTGRTRPAGPTGEAHVMARSGGAWKSTSSARQPAVARLVPRLRCAHVH